MDLDIKTDDSARRPVILVVDDEPIVHAVLDLGLRQEGFDVWLASDGREALERYGRYAEEIDLVLLEVCLPGMDGPQTMAILRQLNPGIRCCFMSASATQYTEEELRRQGAALLNKPFTSAEAAQVFWRLLGRPYPGPHQWENCPSVLSWRQWGQHDSAPAGHPEANASAIRG